MRRGRKRAHGFYDSDDDDKPHQVLEHIRTDMAALPTQSFKRQKHESSGPAPVPAGIQYANPVSTAPQPRVVSMAEIRRQHNSESNQPRFRTAADYYESRRRMMGEAGPPAQDQRAQPRAMPASHNNNHNNNNNNHNNNVAVPGGANRQPVSAAQQLSAALTQLQQQKRESFDELSFDDLARRFPKEAITRFKAAASALIVRLLQQSYARSHSGAPDAEARQAFRHHARKVTHTVIKKELRSVLEKRDDSAPLVLDFNARVEEKIRAYVAGYSMD
jgi:hypothetical protein